MIIIVVSLDSRYSSHSAYFRLDSITGRLTVGRNLQQLEQQVGPGLPLLLRVIAQVSSFPLAGCSSRAGVQEVEAADPVQARQNRLVDQISSVEIAVIVEDVINRPPRFMQAT